jgi:hypothetical protein
MRILLASEFLNKLIPSNEAQDRIIQGQKLSFAKLKSLSESLNKIDHF